MPPMVPPQMPAYYQVPISPVAPLVPPKPRLPAVAIGFIIAAGVVLLTLTAVLVAIFITVPNTSIDAPSQEQFNKEHQVVIAVNGKDEVFWAKGGYIYHLCQESPDLQRPSKDNQIYSGTLEQAHAAGKTSLARSNECGCNNTDGSGTCGLNLGAVSQPTDQPS